jgi:tripartite-type tricarboxylate transporter receptor subunit TctC
VAELVAIARAKPGQITFGSGGPGNLAHLSFEMINNRVGIKTTHVPYKSGVLAQIGVLGKEIDVLLDTPNTVPNVKSGKLKALAVTTATRWRDLPDVPTLDEAGIPGFDYTTWYGLMAPAATPRAIVERLNAETVAQLNSATLQRRMEAQGLNTIPSTPAQFTARLRSETEKWARAAAAAKILPE